MKKVLYTLGGLIALLLVLGIWGLIEPRVVLDTDRKTVAVPNLPPEWAGRRIAVISDWQLGTWWANDGMVERAMQTVAKQKPDALLLVGDYLEAHDQDPTAGLAQARRFARIVTTAGVPTFAVLGNHDWGVETKQKGERNPQLAARIDSTLTAAGVRVLRNQAATLTRGSGNPLYLVGIGPEWPKADQPKQALAPVPKGAARIVFMHNPATFTEIPAGDAPFAIGAHTHGGQIRIPFTPDWTWMRLVGKNLPADGWAEPSYGQPGNRLFVTRGIGMSVAPIRINCPPQIVLFTLQPR